MDSACEDLFLQISVVICHVLICCLKLFGGGVVERNEVGVAKEVKCRPVPSIVLACNFGMKE